MSEEQSILTSDIIYSPASLLHVFNSALAPAQTKKIILLKGIYQAGKGVPYSGYFYDTLKDETTDALLTLVVPALLRGELKNNKTIEFHGYISKRIVANAGRIEIHAVITQLLQQTVNKYADKEVKAIEIQQKKAALGYRDVDSFIKSRIVEEETIRITILVGKTAIIDSDIKHALEEAIGFYDLTFLRINLSSKAEILETLKRHNDLRVTDILILSRGGGENMEIFNSPEIAAYCLELEPYFLTAIGHKENTSLVQRVADKAFITPTALGQYLNTIYNETVAQLQHSKARLVETITLQLSTNYDKQVQNLQERIRHLEELNGKSAGLQQQEIQFLKNQMSSLQAKEFSLLQSAEAYKKRVRLMEAKATAATTRFWVVIIIVALVCVLVGKACGATNKVL